MVLFFLFVFHKLRFTFFFSASPSSRVGNRSDCSHDDERLFPLLFFPIFTLSSLFTAIDRLHSQRAGKDGERDGKRWRDIRAHTQDKQARFIFCRVFLLFASLGSGMGEKKDGRGKRNYKRAGGKGIKVTTLQG